MSRQTLGGRAGEVLVAAWPAWLLPALLVSFPSTLGAPSDPTGSSSATSLAPASGQVVALTAAAIALVLLVHCASKGALIELLAESHAGERPSFSRAASRGIRATAPLLSILAILLAPFVLAEAALGVRISLVASGTPLGRFAAAAPNTIALVVLAVGLLLVSIVDPVASRLVVRRGRRPWVALVEAFSLLKMQSDALGRAWVASAGLWIIWGLLATVAVAAIRFVTAAAPGATFLGVRFPLEYLVGYSAFVYARALTAALWGITFAEQTADSDDMPPSETNEEPLHA